ncbi:MAG: hypothetical protein CMK31_00185, partial [Porticoccaceae bacterium]|nr:hypothetical protein [Porticoccaceae bacterium]
QLCFYLLGFFKKIRRKRNLNSKFHSDKCPKLKDQLLSDILKNYPKIKNAGDGPSVPQWFIHMQDSFKTFTKIMP